ncbi:tyrosine-type recombinase/integrase [Sphingomonas mucosissima]|uniref:Tyrosine recombinase XerC n=1 Tax=Sphingomonas mucosissima TaxID=370959 RepID=A0A245ZQH5_9SPHN|nr:tyrosine-type recombinase/integrase [Sphingomonas mucosissima]OWK32005.1 tyrosine recombinase XerC [Sphingomonas mucosissima]
MPHPARVLERDDVHRLVQYVATNRHPLRDRVIVVLSFKAGLRACEIAGLDWTMVLRANGHIGDQLLVAASIAKNGAARQLPIHPELATALRRLHNHQGKPTAGPVIRSERGAHMRAGSIVNWFAAAYAALGLQGCSSHSGRRTFITRSARLIARTGGSLRDVQELAGHRQLTTTERYIQGDRDSQRRLVRLV